MFPPAPELLRETQHEFAYDCLSLWRRDFRLIETRFMTENVVSIEDAVTAYEQFEKAQTQKVIFRMNG